MEKLIIKYGNIFDYLDGMDAIVNSTNKYMTYGSGICGQIYRKAGREELEEYCKNNFSENMKVNEVRITKGFNLGIDIIHICCPKAYESKEPLKELLESYENIFKMAKNSGYINIISPSLGTGINGYKYNEMKNMLIHKLKKLVYEYDINFSLVLKNEDTMEIYNKFN